MHRCAAENNTAMPSNYAPIMKTNAIPRAPAQTHHYFFSEEAHLNDMKK